MRTCRTIGFIIMFAAIAPWAGAQGSLADFERADGVRAMGRGKVYKASVDANWIGASDRFWYRTDVRGAREFILVDAEAATRGPAFDHARMAAGLTEASGTETTGDALPFEEITFVEDGAAVEFTVDRTRYRADLETYECEAIGRVERPAQARGQRGRRGGQRGRRGGGQRGQRGRGGRAGRGAPGQPRVPSGSSPDGRYVAFVRDHNLFALEPGTGEEIQLSRDGEANHYYANISWSPDSRTVVAMRTEPGDNKQVYLLTSSPDGDGRATLRSRGYDLPGDKFASYEINLFDLESQRQMKVEAPPVDFGRVRLRWKPDGRRFTFEKRDRGHQRDRFYEVDANTGAARVILEETAETFIDHYHKSYIYYTEGDREIIRASEIDGWNHLYLYDAEAGTLKNQITSGQWLVRGVERVDEERRQIWFSASGMDEGRDPYLIHHFRIGFDGTGLMRLTEGDGNHSIAYSPDRQFFIDSYSRVDLPPVTELRRGSDGELVMELERADIADLLETGLLLPEVFSAKGRDSETDIWGIIVRPVNFDPAKSYPVLEYIYAGPHDSHVPKTFRDVQGVQAMAELGFILVQIDGMGTNNRSKAFHDVTWQNLKDAGFPDRIAWMKAAAEKYPYMDLDRVGIYGTSAGGQNSMGGLLFHPEFYKVAVSACGCHDNRMDKASWNEQWMGYPVGPHYGESSNVDNAYRLEGKLLLIVGELDTNVPPESTFRVVDRLIEADKDFDFLMVPGMGHSGGGQYGERRRRDFFIRHLLGVEPRWEG